ncbi:MAG: DNA polymerase III subunit beta [Lentisphaerae bacterium]|nr:DNA polymerase III subunit beta [Lentisphaerota bacterium]
MKFTLSKDVFLKNLQQVQSVVSTHSTLPILFNVLIQAEKQELVLTATDLVVSLRCRMEAAVKKPGASTCPARRLLSIVRELPQAELDIDVTDDQVMAIQCESSNYKLIGLAADDFPALPKFDEARSVSLDQGAFKEMLKKTGYAASTDESRPILNGILILMRDQKLTLVATDGRRLALVEQDIDLPQDMQCSLVIPTKTVNELIKALGDEGTVKIKTTSNLAAFELDSVLITSKLVEGNFPNFRQVIPSQCEERIALDREQLLAAVRRAALLASEKNPSVKLLFAKNQLKIVVVTPDVGEATESLPIKYDGKPLSMVFNPTYLMDPLRTLTCDEVAVELADELSPAVIKCDIPFLYVLMPLRLN